MKSPLIYFLFFLFLFLGCSKERDAQSENAMSAFVNGKFWSGTSVVEWQKYQDVLVLQGVRCLDDANPCMDGEDLTIAIHHFEGQTGLYNIVSPSYGLYRSWFGGDMLHFCGQTDSLSFTGQVSLTVFDTLSKKVECTFQYKAKDAQGRLYEISDGQFYSDELTVLE